MDLARFAVEGRVVPDDAVHPMVFSGSCLSCGRGEMSPGCVSSNLGDRLRALSERGLCDYVVGLLRDASPDDLRVVEALSDAQVAEMNRVAESRQRHTGLAPSPLSP